MAKVVFFNSYKLKKGVSKPDFIRAAEQLKQGHIAKQRGYISFTLYEDGDRWADATWFETMEDAKRFAEASDPGGLAETFYSFLNLSTCRSNFFTAVPWARP